MNPACFYQVPESSASQGPYSQVAAAQDDEKQRAQTRHKGWIGQVVTDEFCPQLRVHLRLHAQLWQLVRKIFTLRRITVNIMQALLSVAMWQAVSSQLVLTFEQG